MIEANYQAILERVKRAAESANRDPAEITLIAVSKTQPIEAIQELYDLGHRVFGESRLQEALPKLEQLPEDIDWHFIGRLQSNKAKRVASHFRTIHTLENEGQLAEIAKANRVVNGFVEVNIAKESKKSGIFAWDLDEMVRKVLHCKQVYLRGLMTIGPALENPNELRPYFAELAGLARKHDLRSLSMGMSDSFEAAIHEGATHIRVGSAIFGARNYN